MFHFISALDESRLSEHARRRLGELRRLFNADRPPPRTPLGRGGSIDSPIPQQAVRHMTEEQWLRAIAKYNTDRENWTTLQGGAVELSRALQDETAADPDRFARFALRLTNDAHPAYAEGILMGLGNAQVPGTPDLVFNSIRHIASLGRSEHDRWMAWPLRNRLDGAIPDDIIELLVDKALHGISPTEDGWDRERGGSESVGQRILSEGINSARGACAQMLGDILIHDVDGHRTALVAPWLNELAVDTSVAVRSCTAHLVAASLRHAEPQALQAFELITQTDDRLLASPYGENLVAYVAWASISTSEPTIRRMLISEFADVRRAGGRSAALAGLELGLTDLLEEARTTGDAAARSGLASVCARRLPHTSNPAAASAIVQELAGDQDQDVRTAVASVAPVLRGHSLLPFKEVVLSLISSPSFGEAVDQLLITLENAPDRIDDLIIASAQQFMDQFGADIGNIATRAAGNVNEVGRLVLRAYAQAQAGPGRSAVLDLIDKLLLSGGFGVDELVGAAERQLSR